MRTPPSLFAVALGIVGSLSALFFLWLLLKIGGPHVTEDVDDLGELIPALAAALACVLAARGEACNIRKGWYFLGLSALSWGIGEAIWCYYEVLLGRQVPFPSLADAGFLLAVPLALGGLLMFFSAPVGLTSRVRALVDTLIVGSAMLLISWLAVLGPVYNTATGSVIAQAIGLAYPVGDVVILSAVVIVAGSSRLTERLPFAWIGAAMTALAVSDSAFAYLTQKGAYGASQLLDTGWVVGYFILALAAIKPRASKRYVTRKGERTLLLYVPVLAAMILVGVRALSGQGLDAFGRWNFLAVFFFIVVRQMLTLRENRFLTRDLEAKVQARTAELLHSEQRLRSLIQNVSDIISVVSRDGTIFYVSPSVDEVLGYSQTELTGANLLDLVHPDDRSQVAEFFTDRSRILSGGRRSELRVRARDGSWRHTETIAGDAIHDPDADQFVLTTRDVSERKQLELELRHAQKLEAVGQLAAGIAHEINTPIQFVGDTGQFLTTAFSDISEVLDVYGELRIAADHGAVTAELRQRVTNAEQAADLAYLRERVPEALQRISNGVHRVSEIVRAMRTFAHQPAHGKTPLNLNDAIRNTLIVARAEYKHVADVTTDLAELPAVECNAGDINQVLINLIVNAAHAIADVVAESSQRGAIHIRTRAEGEHVSISIADTGSGIAPEVADRVFEPFFTTKEIGRGTGQGLAISRSIVVQRHGGSLTFETQPGKSTTFIVRLPLQTAASEPRLAA